MKKNTKYLISLMIVFGLSTMIFVPPVQVAFASVMDSDTLRERLFDFIDAWQLAMESDMSEGMEDAWNFGADINKHQLAAVDFNWMDTFNFTNSKAVFGEETMTSDEVGDNLQNYMFQLLYSDIQAACEVSILDIMLIRVFDSLILDWINQPMSGFCNGMSQACRDYYTDPAKIPMGRDYAHLLPNPSINETYSKEMHGDVSESAIKEYVLWKGSAAFFNPNHLINWIRMYLGLPSPAGGITNAQQTQLMMDEMMLGTPYYAPQVILLMAPCWEVAEPTSSHFVNVFDYDVNSNGSITLYIYNNWYWYDPDPAGQTLYDDWILLDANGNFKGTHLAPYGDGEGQSMFTRLSFYPATMEYNSILSCLMDLIPQLLSMAVFSPVDMTVTDPLGRTVGIGEDGVTQLEFPAIPVEDNGVKHLVFPFAPGLPYTVNLTGTAVGEYRLEANRVVDGQLISENITGETEPGQNDVFTVTLDADGLSVAEIGVYLKAPTILSGSSVDLEWTEFNNEQNDFVAYEIYYSEQPNELGTLSQTIDDITSTSAIVGGLSGSQTYFFTVRVVTDGEDIYDSNRVGAALPEDFTFWLYVAAGVGGFAILLLVVFVCRRKK